MSKRKLAAAPTHRPKLATGGVPVPFPDGWDVKTQIGVVTTTHLTFLDSFLGGGVANGESYGILGPYGGGKSTLSMMITTEAAKAEFRRWVEAGREGVPGRVYHFIYDDSVDDLRLLSLSYLAGIPKDRMATLIQLRNPDAFSRAGQNYQQYEVARYRDQLASGETPLGEWERCQEAVEIMNHCWRLVDMTGADTVNLGRGYGLVDELAGIIARDLALTPGATCRGALADYVGAAVRAHFGAVNRDESEKRVVIQDWPFQMKRKIGIRFNCPVWSIQQLNTESNACAPGHLPRMTDSADCKSFAEFCDFCFVIGLPNRTGQMPFVARKHRRQGEHPPIVLTLRGADARIDDTRTEWDYHERTRRIVRCQIAEPHELTPQPVSEDDDHAPAANRNDIGYHVASPGPWLHPHRTDWRTSDRFRSWRR